MSADASQLVAQRYTTALFSLASEQGQTDAVLADLKTIATLAEDASVQRLFASPVVGRADAAAALAALLEKTGASALTRRFMGLLALNRRLALTLIVARQFEEEAMKSRGEDLAVVTSAAPLSEEQKASLAAALQKRTGRKVNLRTRENADILGGLVVELGGRTLDASLAGQFDRLSQRLKVA